MNTKINYQLQGQAGKIATVGDLETNVSSFSPSSESIIYPDEGQKLETSSLNLPTVAIYLLELEVDNLFWCFTFAPKQYTVSFKGKFPNF